MWRGGLLDQPPRLRNPSGPAEVGLTRSSRHRTNLTRKTNHPTMPCASRIKRPTPVKLPTPTTDEAGQSRADHSDDLPRSGSSSPLPADGEAHSDEPAG